MQTPQKVHLINNRNGKEKQQIIRMPLNLEVRLNSEDNECH